jgi:hypothetical protein
MSTRAATTKKAEQPVAAAKASAGITPERIQARAYEVFLARNGGDGDALADWLQAERELNGSGLPGDAEGSGSKSRQRASGGRTDGQRRDS